MMMKKCTLYSVAVCLATGLVSIRGATCDFRMSFTETAPRQVDSLSFTVCEDSNAAALFSGSGRPGALEILRLEDYGAGVVEAIAAGQWSTALGGENFRLDLPASLPSGFYTARIHVDFFLDGMPVFQGEQSLETANGTPIEVDAYSVPSLADWNNDGFPDLIVGEQKEGGALGRIRVWLNQGTAAKPVWSNTALFAKTTVGNDIELDCGGCLGVFPRLFDWNRDGLPDLIVGRADGTINFLESVGPLENPRFKSEVLLTAGGAALPLSIRATLDIADWNNDGIFDLITGELDGYTRVFLNTTTTGLPVLQNGFTVPGVFISAKRSSPCFIDFDYDGLPDLLTGDTNGQLRFFRNVGTLGNPSFAAGILLEAGGSVVDMDDGDNKTPRSRPWVGDYNGDGIADILVGTWGGGIRYYQGQATANPLPGVPVFAAAEILADGTRADLACDEYSTPFLMDWNQDGLPDLVSGEKRADGQAQVRVWLNSGTLQSPVFTTSQLAQAAAGGVVEVPGGGCLGVFVRTCDWNGDGRFDLILGLADGRVDGSFEIWLDTAAAGEPAFQSAGKLAVGPAGAKQVLKTERRATCDIADINGDDLPDFIWGDLTGTINYCPGLPAEGGVMQVDASRSLAGLGTVPNGRASVRVVDLNADGLPDIVSGNTSGWVLLYLNEGTASAPSFGAGRRLQAGGDIDIDDAIDGDVRSRPWVGDYNADGWLDLLVGARDGLMRLYAGSPWQPGLETPFVVPEIDGPGTVEIYEPNTFTAYPQNFSCAYSWTFPHAITAGMFHSTAFQDENPAAVVEVSITLPDGQTFGRSTVVDVRHDKNHAPSIAGTHLVRHPDGSLEVVPEGWSDDWTPPEEAQYEYQWFVNGVAVDGETGPTYAGSAYPNDVIFCVVTPKNPVVDGKPMTVPWGFPVEDGCAFVASVSAGWNLLYAPTANQAAAATVRRGASPVADLVSYTANVWVCDTENGRNPEAFFTAGIGFWVDGHDVSPGNYLLLGRGANGTPWHQGCNMLGGDLDPVLMGYWHIADESLWAWDADRSIFYPIAVPGNNTLPPGNAFWAVLETP